MDSAKITKMMKRDNKTKVGSLKLPPIDSMKGDVKTVVNVDPEYYSLLQGRPIRPDTSIARYKQNIKDIAFQRTLQGYLIDEITRIDKEIQSENRIYETTLKHFEECQHSFDKFLAYDNDKTIVIMKKSDTLAKDLMNQMEEHKAASYELASIKAKLQYIEETLLILLSFENFLLKAAPILWQQSENVKLDVKHGEFIKMDSNIFQKVNVNDVKERLNELQPLKLYFDTPDKLMTVFYQLEKQNLNYLLLTEELTLEKNKFVKAKDHFKELLEKEVESFRRKINGIEEIIRCNENRETELKEVFYRILGDKMKYLVSSESILQLFNHVEFAYEKLIDPNDIQLSTLEMALSLETHYDNLMLDISVFDLDLIKAIEKETYEGGIKEMKQAKKASTLLKDVEKLSRRLKSSYEPAKTRSYE